MLLSTGNLGEGLASEWTVEVCGFLRSESAALSRYQAHPSSIDTFSLSTTKVRGWTTAPWPLSGLIDEGHQGHTVP